MKRIWIAAATLLLACLWAGPAGAQNQLGVGLFAPEVPFSGPAQRYEAVRALAKHLAAITGRPVEGKAFKSAADLRREIKARRIHFAVLGAVYVASRRSGRILATARFRKKTSARWSIMSKGKQPVTALRGKTLQIPTLGPLALGLVQYGLLDGNVDVRRYFKVARSPDLTSAVTAVRLGQAHAVVAPVDTPGLVPTVRARALPAPAFVVVAPRLPQDLVAAVRKGILTFSRPMATLQGWRASGRKAYSALAGAARRRPRRMVLHPTTPARLRVSDLVDTRSLHGRLPPLDDLLWAP